MSEISTPATGDPDRDRYILDQFAKNDALIRGGKCPNECGDLIKRPEVRYWECPKCNFIYQVRSINA